MSIRKVICGLSAIPLLVPAAVSATPLEPTSKWWLDYDEAQCIASRDYGTKDDPLAIGFKPSPMGGIMRIIVVRSGNYMLADQYPVSVQFDGQPPMKMSALQYAESKKKVRVMSINVPRATVDANKDAGSITIETSGFRRTFAMTDVPALLAELDKCLVDLRETWNVGKEDVVATGATPVKPLSDVFRPEDYPVSALVGHDQGAVQAVLLIDEGGNIRDCSIETSSDIPTLDTMSCYIFQERAHFSPATDKSGQPVKSSFSQRIAWRLAR